MPTGSTFRQASAQSTTPPEYVRHALNKNVTFINQRPKILLRLAQVGDFHVSFRLGLLANTTIKPRFAQRTAPLQLDGNPTRKSRAALRNILCWCG